MADGKDVIRVPDLLGLISAYDVFQLAGAVKVAAAAVGVSKYGVRAPVALVRAASRRDQVHAPHAVMTTPNIDVPCLVDRGAVGPGNRVQIGDLGTFRIGDDSAGVV